MQSTFTVQARGALLQGLYAGLTLAESAEEAGLPPKTVANWLTRGRREHGTEYSAFAVAVDEARDIAARAPMSEHEFRGHLNKAVRSGSVTAMKVWLELRDREQEDEDDPFAELDAEGTVIERLARRRTNGHAASDYDNPKTGAAPDDESKRHDDGR